MIDKKTVQTALAISEEGGQLNPSPRLMIELCRAWLALDAAPEVLIPPSIDITAIANGVSVDHVSVTLLGAEARQVAGQRVRLVATPPPEGSQSDSVNSV